MTPAALAIDLGTTAAKAAVVTLDGRILGSGLRPLTTLFGPEGAAEQDAEAVWQTTLAACSEALGEAGSDAVRAIRVVCATSQWASIVPVGADGRPVGPMMMWLDQRGETLSGALLSGHDAGEHFARWSEIHGFIPTASLSHVLFLQNTRPDIHARTAAYLEPMDYLNARLTGRLAASSNTAMPFALTDNRRLDAVAWSDELIQRAGVDATRLPELVDSMAILAPLAPDVATTLGLRRDVVVAVAANDSIAAALGTGAIEPGKGTVVMGTTGVLTAHHHARVVATERFVMTMPSALPDRYYLMAEAGLGGKVVETFLEQIVLGHDEFSVPPPVDAYERLSRVASTVPAGAGGLLFLPWLIGSLAPAPNFGLRGAFLGVSMETTRAHFIRAVLEGVALQMRWLADEAEHLLGIHFESLRFAGGGAQSDTWAAIMADVLGRPIEQITDPRRANCRGAGFLGLLSLGALTLGDLDALVPVRRRYEPRPEATALFDERTLLYRELHTSLAQPMKRLRRGQ